MTTRRATTALLLLSFCAFISLGLPDVILGVAWPSIRQTFSLPISSLGALLFTGMLGYLASSFFAGWITARLGVGKLLLLSSFLITVALIGYAVSPTWRAMVMIGLLSGLGAGAIDGAMNAFAAKHFSAKIVNWLHACWGIGATAGPMLMTLVITNGLSWRVGYAILAGLLAAMTAGFAMSVRLWGDGQASPPESRDDAAAVVSMPAALSMPIVWSQIAIFFLYTGLEGSVGQLAYSWLTESRGASARAAGFTVGAYWASLTIGRVLFGLVCDRVPPAILVRISMIAAPSCAALAWLGEPVVVNLVAVAVLGFFLAPIYPLMISLTLARVGKPAAGHSVGFQVSAGAIGGAAVPAVGGVLANRVGLDVVPPFVLAVSVMIWMVYEVSSVRRRANSALPAPVP